MNPLYCLSLIDPLLRGLWCFYLAALYPVDRARLLTTRAMVRADAVCFVYTCRRLIDLSLIAGSVNGDGFAAQFTCIDPATVPPPPPDPCTAPIALTDRGEVSHSELDNHQNCDWALSCTNSSLAPRLTFGSFNTESNFDYLYVQMLSALCIHAGD